MRRYDLAAHMYDMRYAEEQTAKIQAALEDLHVKRGSLVLDAGCGTGVLFDFVADKAETVGLDISKRSLLQARERARNFRSAHLVLADADNTPLKQSIFTHVFAFTLIQNMPNPVKTLKEIDRIAREDAAIVVTGLKKAFTISTFEDLLKSVALKIVVLKSNGLKCYVAVCAKIY